MRELRESQTVKGKRFFYSGDVTLGIIAYSTDPEGKSMSGGHVRISSGVIQFIGSEIKEHGEILMGAIRDVPAGGSLGARLRERRLSPQLLSYVVPLLVEAGFCNVIKKGRSHYLRYTTTNP